jgi:hypothetical protein
MAHASQILFNIKELAEVLVKQQGIHNGHWGVLLKIGVAGANMPGPTGELLPCAIVPISEIGIQQYEEPSSMTVDAAKVNPAKEA